MISPQLQTGCETELIIAKYQTISYTGQRVRGYWPHRNVLSFITKQFEIPAASVP